jgi:hypothetical protein
MSAAERFQGGLEAERRGDHEEVIRLFRRALQASDLDAVDRLDLIHQLRQDQLA